MPMGKYGAYAELLDMAARVAARSYSHCPQTSRLYYKPPPTKHASNNGSARGNGSGRSSAEASSARTEKDQQQQQQQHQAAVWAALDATDIILCGGA